MARRTNELKVQQVLLDHYDGKSDLDPFIDTATAMTDYLAGKDSDGVLTSALLERIETFLAAHYYGHADQFKASEKRGKSSAVYQGEWGMGLRSTQYGQVAVDLDPTGTLASLGKRPLMFKWMGLPRSEQTKYEDRD